MVACLTGFLSLSCQKDELSNVSTGNNVRFTVTEPDRWNMPPTAKSRSAEDGMAENVPVVTNVLSLQGENPADTLFLHAMVTDGIESGRLGGSKSQTRAAPITSMDTYGSFGVLTSVYKGSWDEAACLPEYMYDVEVTKASGWTTAERWPGTGYNMRFFAYAPYKGRDIVLSEKTKAGTPSIAYTVPAAVAEQKDLLVAASAEMAGNTGGAAPLNFRHVLTAVRFTTGESMLPGRITKIALKGVYSSGTHAMGSDSWNFDNAKTADFSQELKVQTDGSVNQEITSAEGTFMMLPQTLPAGASIEVSYQDDLTWTNRTLTASIAGSQWPMGKTVTYRISPTSIDVVPTFTVTPPADFRYDGSSTVPSGGAAYPNGGQYYYVTSYATVSGQQNKPLPWEAEFVEDDGAGGYRVIAKPDWVTLFTTSGGGSTSAAKYEAGVTPQADKTTANLHNERLKNATPVAGIYDLSTKGGKAPMRTANCYIINAPGTYTLPLVYGNAIDYQKYPADGKNTSAYTSSLSTVTNYYILSQFQNHDSEAITDPYIYNNAFCVPEDAVLVWMDAQGLVSSSSVQLTDNDKDGTFDHLQFEVPQATIQQGNAIVAVRGYSKNGQVAIMWSWHIWVTDYVPELEPTIEDYDAAKISRDKLVTTVEGVKYTFMGTNLGWCDGESTSYAARSVKVRFTQTGTGKTQVITVNQPAQSTISSGSNPYFQFGRKDPMLPIVCTNPDAPVGNRSYKDKEQYYADEAYKWRRAYGPVSLGQSIQTPFLGFIPPNDHRFGFNWGTAPYRNLWNVDNDDTGLNDKPIIKTIYDPSPVGYCLPAPKAFTGFTCFGHSTSGEDMYIRFPQYNSPYKSKREYWDNSGWIFYCNPMKGEGIWDTAGGTIYFQAGGSRDINGNVSGVGEYVCYWAAVNSDYAYALYAYSSRVAPTDDYVRSNAYSVRPVREK